jgi:hypothetical protein
MYTDGLHDSYASIAVGAHPSKTAWIHQAAASSRRWLLLLMMVPVGLMLLLLMLVDSATGDKSRGSFLRTKSIGSGGRSSGSGKEGNCLSCLLLSSGP